MNRDFTFSPPFCLICNDSTNFKSNETSDSTSSSSNEAEELNLLQILCKWISVVSNKINNNNNNNYDNQNEKESCCSSSSSSLSFSSFCPKCRNSVEKLGRIQQQIESIKVEMSSVVHEILSTVINSCPISKDQHSTAIKTKSKNRNEIVNSKQREFLKMRQQICEYFCPNLAEIKVEDGDDLTSDDELNEFKYEADLSNDCDFSPHKNDTAFSHESEEDEEEESKPPIVFHSPLLNFNDDSYSKSKSPPKTKKKEEIQKLMLINKKPPQKSSTSFSSLIKPTPKLNQNPPKIGVSPKSYKTLKQKLKEKSLKVNSETSGFPPFLVNHPKRDNIKIEGDGKYVYKNKFHFENIPGTAGYKCLVENCQVLTRTFDAMMRHLRQHEPNPPKRPVRKRPVGPCGPFSYQSLRKGKRPLLTMDCGNGEYLTNGKYKFRKVEPESPISSPNPNSNGEKAKSGVKFLCDTCGQYTNTRTQMSSHIRDVHAIPLHFKCQFCSKEFNVKKNYESHLMVHSEIPTEICHVCGLGFKRKDRLADHMNEHQNIQFNCPRENCDKVFKNKPALKRHLQYHDGVKKFQCTQCGKFFMKPRSLQNHITNFHDQIRFVCSIGNCTKKFKYRANLRRHMKTVVHDNKNKNKKNNKNKEKK